MSIQEQLVEDMKALFLSDPKHLIKMIKEMPNNRQDFQEYRSKLRDAINEKAGDIDLGEFCQLNGYTESITDIQLNIGEIILVCEQKLSDYSRYDDEYGAYSVTFASVTHKISDISYGIKRISLTNNVDNKYLDMIDINMYYDIANFINFHEKSWGLECNDCWKNYPNGEGCVCDKVKIFRKN